VLHLHLVHAYNQARAIMSSVIPAPVASGPGNAAPSNLPLIDGLEAGLIPLREFPLRKWYYATPLWYYHTPAVQHQLKRDPKFYELVDDQLRELCITLQAAGLYTTPSCQGHFYPRERFEQIWDELIRDQATIRGDGLIVKDSETDHPHLFRDAGYALPWPDFAAFYQQINAHQNEGYIGIAVPPERHALIELLQKSCLTTPTVRYGFDQELTQILGQPLFGIHVNPASPHERDLAWHAVTSFFRSVLAGRSNG
jgi:hypothetical protein